MAYTIEEELEFIESLYDDANEQLSKVYEEQKNNRDSLLSEIANIMLTYAIVDTIMDMSKKEKTIELARLTKIITKSSKVQATLTESVLNTILTNTTKNTFNFYSYNAKLKDVQKIIDANFKGKHFSERIWDNETETAKHLYKQINDFLQGKINVNQIKKDLERTFNNSAYEVGRLAETEVSRVSNNAFDRFCIETNVKRVRYDATLDSKLCIDCAQYDNEIFDFDKKIELPKHPKCRCHYSIVD